MALGISHVPEGRRIFKSLTVTENLRMGAVQRKDAAGVQADTERVYSLFPILKERTRQVAGTLSGGEQQMLSIGRALMGRPKLLLLDEPSLGLAPLVVGLIFDTIRLLKGRGHYHPARGAKRSSVPRPGRPGLCYGKRPHHLGGTGR